MSDCKLDIHVMLRQLGDLSYQHLSWLANAAITEFGRRQYRVAELRAELRMFADLDPSE